MFNVGGGEILVILLVALLVLGPDKLPEAARGAGRLMRQVRSVAQGFQDEVRAAIHEDEPTRRPTAAAPSSAPARQDLHPGAGAGPALPPAAAPAEPTPGTDAAPDAEPTTYVDEDGWRAEGPSGSFS